MISRGTKRDNIPSAVAFAVTVGFDALAGLYFEWAAAESVIADRLFRCGGNPRMPITCASRNTAHSGAR